MCQFIIAAVPLYVGFGVGAAINAVEKKKKKREVGKKEYSCRPEPEVPSPPRPPLPTNPQPEVQSAPQPYLLSYLMPYLQPQSELMCQQFVWTREVRKAICWPVMNYNDNQEKYV